jgi:hypothetical protein
VVLEGLDFQVLHCFQLDLVLLDLLENHSDLWVLVLLMVLVRLGFQSCLAVLAVLLGRKDLELLVLRYFQLVLEHQMVPQALEIQDYR